MGSAWTGERVRLRGVEPGDWRALMEFDQASDDMRDAWRLERPWSAEAYRRWATERAVKEPDPDEFSLIVEGRDRGVPVGLIRVHHADRANGTFSYGLTIGAAHQRRGYATEVIALLLRYMFAERRFHKCDVEVYASNSASIALHQRLGFTEEGRRRESRYAAGVFEDVVLFGMTAEELDQQAGGD